jgi:hypothetical protein
MCYAAGAQDASRLLDLCRQCILFDSLAGVAACLTAMAEDSSVKILQVASPSVRTAVICVLLTGLCVRFYSKEKKFK